MIAVVALLLIPPALPAPPRDLMAAAAELRQAAPLSVEVREAALDRATLKSASGAVNGKLVWLLEAKSRMGERLARRRDELESRVDSCLDEQLARGYDLTTLREMKDVVASKAGSALWERAMTEPLRYCYEEQVGDFLIGFTQHITWLADHKLLDRVPRYDPNSDPMAFANQVEGLCGRDAEGVLQAKRGALGISATWIDRDIKRDNGRGDTFWCLTSAAKVGGYELVAFTD